MKLLLPIVRFLIKGAWYSGTYCIEVCYDISLDTVYNN